MSNKREDEDKSALSRRNVLLASTTLARGVRAGHGCNR